MNMRYPIVVAVVLIVSGLAVFHGNVAFVANSMAGIRSQLVQASFMLIPLGIALICALFFKVFQPDQFFWGNLVLLVLGSFWEYNAGFDFSGVIVGFVNLVLAWSLAARALKSLKSLKV
jgi:hypothetical protein